MRHPNPTQTHSPLHHAGSLASLVQIRTTLTPPPLPSFFLLISFIHSSPPLVFSIDRDYFYSLSFRSPFVETSTPSDTLNHKKELVIGKSPEKKLTLEVRPPEDSKECASP